MTKPLVNNRITYRNINGRVIQHDQYFDGGSPTFGSVRIAGDAQIEGGLYVQGNAWILDTNIMEFEDNIVVINSRDVSSGNQGVTLHRAGLQIERGGLPDFQIVYDENFKRLMVGTVGNNSTTPLLPVALYEPETMFDNGFMIWNSSGSKMISSNTMDIDVNFDKSVYINNKESGTLSSKLHTDSAGNFNIHTGTGTSVVFSSENILVPTDSTLSFGDTNAKVYSEQMGEIILNAQTVLVTGGATISSTNDLTLHADNNIHLKGDAIVIGTDPAQKIQELDGDLLVSSGNHIYFSVGENKNVNIQDGRGLQFGEGGQFYSSNDEVLFTGGTLRFVENIPVSFGEGSNIKENVFGQLELGSKSNVRVGNTDPSSSTISGALVIDGGVGVKEDLWAKNVYITNNLVVTGTTVTENTETLLVDRNLIIVNRTVTQDIDGGLLIKRPSTASTNFGTQNVYATIYFREATDEMTFAFTDMNPLSNFVTINEYLPIRAGSIRLMSTSDVNIAASTASLVTPGGVIVGKRLHVHGDITGPRLNITNISSANLSVDMINSQSTQNATNASTGSIIAKGGVGIQKDLYVDGISHLNSIRVVSTEQSTSQTNGSLVVRGGVGIEKDLYIGGRLNVKSWSFTDTTPASNSTTGSLLLPGGLTIRATENATSHTSGGALLVAGGASISKDMYIKGMVTLGDDNTDSVRLGLLEVNNTTGSVAWYNLTQINTQAHYDLVVYSKHDTLNVVGRGSSAQHSRKANDDVSVSERANVYVYIDGTTGLGNIYAKLPANEKVFVHLQTNRKLAVSKVSDPSLVYDYTTEDDATLQLSLGELNVEQALHIGDTFPIIGYNNTNDDRLGLLLSRSEQNITSDTPDFVDTLPSQPQNPPLFNTQLLLSNTANGEAEFYVGWTIKNVTTGEVRKVVAYGSRVITVDTPWGTLPQQNHEISLFNVKYIIPHYDDAASKFKVGMGVTKGEQKDVVLYKDCPVEFGNTKIADTTQSINSSSGSLIVVGGVSIKTSESATSATSGNGLTVAGGVAVSKNLYVGDNCVLGNPSAATEALVINKSTPNVLLQSASGETGYIRFGETNSSVRYDISRTGSDIFTITSVGAGVNSLTVNSSGNVGFGTTSPNSFVTLPSGGFITNDSNTGFVGVLGSTLNGTGGRVMANASGDAILDASSTGLVRLQANGETCLSVKQDRTISIDTTTLSSNASTGSLVVSGGMSIRCTQNAVSAFNGGALTVAGGVSVQKDLYIEGNLIVKGLANLSSAVGSPSVSVLDLVNCIHYQSVFARNSKVMKTGDEFLLTFWVGVVPTVESQLCEFQFDLPERASNLVERGDLVGMCSGWTDNTSLIPVFNVVCVGVTGTTRGVVKFQSVSKDPHYFSIVARYTAV